jgi:DNA-binding transcriptional ArsR family regulator
MRDRRYKRKALVLKAMAHPSRLAMLEALADGERCVCELQRVVGSDMSTVSKHLALLKAAGLVADRKEGLWVHYRLRVPCVLKFMGCIEAVLTGRQAHADGATYAKA